jgi:general secretion pathway protein D
MKKLTLTILIFLAALTGIIAQPDVERTLKGFTRPDELVTLASTISFDQAMELISKVSESVSGKRVVSTISSVDPIGIELTNMPYDKALIVLVQMRGLIYEEKEDVIVVKRKTDIEIEKPTAETYAPVETREVKISAVFFEMDVNESRQRGIDWKFLLSRKSFDIGGKIGIDREAQEEQQGGGQQGQQQNLTNEFELETSGNFDFGGFFGQATALFKFFESENLGEIIASPNVTVRDRNSGRIQVGSDISIKQRDFAGNVIENFFSTGSIIDVTPYVYTEEGIDYILLNIEVERSSFVPDPTTTIINKTAANTQVLMLNGEETVIGGLFLNEETKVRNGIPFLKDLPWWVFGIRYLTGSDEIRVNKKELVILIKTELVPTLKERTVKPQLSSPIKDEIHNYREQIKFHKFNQSTGGTE